MKTAIVYFSYTGHTRQIAKQIQENLHCDLFELKRKEPYSEDYEEVVADEQNQEGSQKIPEIEPIPIDIDAYDRIILGTPTWWYRPCPVVRAFLKQYDLSSKTIVPFATNAGWLGRTLKEIKELCPNSTIEKEMNLVFTEDYKENKLVTKKENLQNWINSL